MTRAKVLTHRGYGIYVNLAKRYYFIDDLRFVGKKFNLAQHAVDAIDAEVTNYDDALRELHVARQQFEQADMDHVDAAAYRLKAAELRMSAALREARVAAE